MSEPAHAEALRQEAQLDNYRTQIQKASDQLADADTARAAAVAQCRDITRKAYNAGMPELHIARAMKVNRRTVRRWLGKPE